MRARVDQGQHEQIVYDFVNEHPVVLNVAIAFFRDDAFAADYTTCDAIFYAGDMTSYIDRAEAPFEAFIDVSVKHFASSKPFDVVRGNHETRGNLPDTRTCSQSA